MSSKSQAAPKRPPSQTTPVSKKPPASSTRSKTNEANSRVKDTPEELSKMKEDASQSINSAEKAAEFLREEGWIDADTAPNLDTLIYLIFFTARLAKTPAIVNGLRSLGFYAEAIRSDRFAEVAAENTVERLSPTIDQLNSLVNTLRDMEQSGKVLMEKANTTIMQLQEERGRLIPEVVKAVEDTTAARTATESMDEGGGWKEVTHKVRSYASALKASVPQNHETILARQDLRNKQVLIDGLSRKEDSSDNLTEEELLQKARLALESLMNIIDVPDGTTIVAAKRLRNGGVLFEMSTTAAATWLRGRGVMKNFSDALGGDTMVKAQTYAIIAEFVPVSFNINLLHSWSEVETRSNLNIDSIKDGRWIKPVNKRQRGQRFAHLIVNLTSPEAANTAIRNGLIIAGKRVSIRKLIAEPRRCLKCQRFDPPHMARDCKQIHDTCGTCGSLKHITAECTEEDESKFRCVNCNATGHASWSRDCPIFHAKRDRLLHRRPDSQYVFYPTRDPMTWEQHLEEQATPWSRPPREYHNATMDRHRYDMNRPSGDSPEAFNEPAEPWPPENDPWSGRSSSRMRQTTLDHFQPSQPTQRRRNSRSEQSDRFPTDEDYA